MTISHLPALTGPATPLPALPPEDVDGTGPHEQTDGSLSMLRIVHKCP